MASEARKLVWMGSIPLQLHLHESEVTTLPPPPPHLILAPRNGYFPLLVPLVKPQFQSALPIGQDTGWFEYKGLPLKWHFPIGVLFDLLCVEPERPWNLTVHFRGYPPELLPYDGEDAIKWAFINSLKEASYLMYGSAKSVMNLSQSDQLNLWRSVIKGDMECYDRICFKLTPNVSTTSSPLSHTSSESLGDTEIIASKTQVGGETLPLKIPIRLYLRIIKAEDKETLGVPVVGTWDDIVYMTRPANVHKEDGTATTLWDALIKMAPQLFACSQSEGTNNDGSAFCPLIWEDEMAGQKCKTNESKYLQKVFRSSGQKPVFSNGILRIQGIETSPDLPVFWIGQNLSGPDQFVHICITIISDPRTWEDIQAN